MRYAKEKSLVTEKMDNQYIIFDQANAQFYELDEISSLVWEKIENESVSDICNFLIKEYEVDLSIIISDVKELIKDLLAKNILTEINY